MENKTIRGMAFSLAATSIIMLTSGCSKKDVSIPETASVVSEEAENVYSDYTYYTGGTYVFKGQEYKEAHDPSNDYIVNEYTGISYDNGLDTDNLFFIRIDGKVYLATKLTDINENNIISKYYAIDTGEFLGQTLDINWYARATKDIDTIIPPGTITVEYKVSVDDDLKDNNYFNGEYGLGKNLCRENIVNALSLFSEKNLTKEQIDSLLTDSLLTTSIVEKYRYPSLTSYSREDYTFIPLRYSDVFGLTTRSYTIGFNGKTSSYLDDMWEFVIEDGDSTRKIVGYRASINQKDSGYTYFYDIESSSYIDLSQFKVLDAKKAVGSKTVGEIIKGLDNSSKVYYPIDSLKVISTLNIEGDEVFEKYYISIRGEYAMVDTYKYEILGENEPVTLSGNYDGSRICIAKNSSLKKTSLGADNGMMISLQECLIKNDLSSYIKETYTEEELSLLLEKLRDKELDLGEPASEIREANRKISIEDIIVVDTSKESGDSVLVASEKKYYVLIPYEMSPSVKTSNPDMTYYETCDHNALGGISLERGYIRIDNLSNTFYCLYKTDGELECISSLKDVLQEIGLDEFIREEYALIDLQILANQINEKQKVLNLN